MNIKIVLKSLGISVILLYINYLIAYFTNMESDGSFVIMVLGFWITFLGSMILFRLDNKEK